MEGTLNDRMMSDNKKRMLAETLAQLDPEERVWAIHYLVQLLAAPSAERMTAKVVRKQPANSFSEEQWEEYFSGQTTKELPEDTLPLSTVLHATAGKTIKPMEKWL